LELLHKRGANLDFCDESGRTPVHRAAEIKLNPSIMEYLLDNGGERYVNAVDVCGENFTKYSMGDTDWRFRELDLSPDRKRKRTPVHYAAENEFSGFYPEVLELLLKRGGNPNFEDERKRTPVHLAVRNRGMKNWRVLKILLKNKGNPNAVDDQLMTPVHFAAMHPHEKIEVMKLLMKHGGDPNAVDSSGRTPLHYAAMNEFIGAPQIIELILANNGNPNAVDNSGLNPAHCCRVKNPSGKVAERILETLMKFGGNSDAADREG
jgi:ankyrin repeat protein